MSEPNKAVMDLDLDTWLRLQIVDASIVNGSSIEEMEAAFQWLKNGKTDKPTKPTLKAV